MADLFTKYNCTNCQDDITGIRVHCAECSSFDLCLQCFSAGAEIGDHNNSHAYQFMDTGTAILSIFRGKGAWTAREELRLLDAIEKYGFGNWEDISKHIETKSAEDAKEEYVNKYLIGTIGRHTWIPALSQRPHLMDHTKDDVGPLGSNSIQRLTPLDVTPEEAAQLGYMPNRDGFEREYDPTAEQLISSLTLNQDDNETDYLLKLAQVDMYTRRLRERARRKRIVRDYQLLANFFRNKNGAARCSREQREFRDRFRVFAQFYTAHEYDRLQASMEREKELRIRLSELNRYRWNGLTKIEECVHFEQHAAVASSKNTGPYGLGRTENPNTGNQQESCLPLQPNKNQAKEDVENANDQSFIDKKSMRHIDDQTCSDGSLRNKNCLDSCRGSSGPSMNPKSMTTSTTTSIVPHQPEQQKLQQKQQEQEEKSPLQQKQNYVNGRQKQLDPVTQSQSMSSVLKNQLNQIQQLPHQLGENLLSSNEIQLCSTLNLPPTRYITLKTILLSGDTSQLSSSISPIENSVRKYLVKAGWISH